ncbi:MAG: hypothetical protein A3F16_08490 [Deltaproteobacteria bacterium RIFCSPHIGHO2_12_FULL_43_9]|nr:MAG: hypothetical protein A3F16_08490 [Deltaproteobacteria bacterium RIFCSPHIGHO2_12_FULL_43_9]
MSILKTIKEKLKWKNVREIPLVSSSIEQLDRLTPEQRRIVAVSFSAASLILLLMIFYRGYNAVSSLKGSISSGQSELNKVAEFSRDYKSFSEDIKSITSEIRRRPKTFQLKNFVSEQALRAGISKAMTTGLKEELMPPKDTLQEAVVNVNFSRVSVKKLMNFLFAVERSRFVTRVKELHMKVRSDDNRFLDASVAVSTVLEAQK